MVSMGGLVLDYWQFVNFHSCYFAFAKQSLITVFSLGRCSVSLMLTSALPKSAEPPKCDSSLTQLHNKRDADISQHLFYGVVGVTILEPFDNKIITNLGNKYNIFHRLILLMKLDTQTYYNLRMILGLECKTYL